MSDTSAMLTTFLANIRIVMVNTTLPANIGSTARAMHTMGLSDLVVVNPKRPIDEDAYVYSAGARDILDNVTLVDSLELAIADCHWVMATSSRQRHIPKPVMTPRQASHFAIDNFLQFIQQATHNQDIHPPHTKQQATDQQSSSFLPKVALVFGREDRGLTNEELQLANFHIQIPANPAYPVLNVAAAVQVIASIWYEVAEERLLNINIKADSDLPPIQPTQPTQESDANWHSIALPQRQQWDEPAITHAQQVDLENHFLQLLQHVSLYNPSQSKMMPQRISRLFGRLQLDVKEYQLLKALLAKLK
ncbi:RNA methyltransferase [Moraxella sp. TY6]